MLLEPYLTVAGAGVIAEKSTKETVNLLKQQQLQLGTQHSAALCCITQVITSSLKSCSVQLDLLRIACRGPSYCTQVAATCST